MGAPNSIIHAKFQGAGELGLVSQPVVSQQEQVSYIKHEEGKGYCVKSEKNSDWNGGCYPSKGEAEKRLTNVEMFKHMKEGSAISPDDITLALRVVASKIESSNRPHIKLVFEEIERIADALEAL